MPDISHLLVSNSTQLDNVDLMGGPRDFTITDAKETGNVEQPLAITLAEYDRPWKPGLTMRRLMAHIWDSTDTDTYIGRRVRLHRDESVSFNKTKTGGTRISHASHLESKVTVTLPVSKGRFGDFTVHPLPDTPPPASSEPSREQVADCTDVAVLKGMYDACPSGSPMKQVIVDRKAELNGGQA